MTRPASAKGPDRRPVRPLLAAACVALLTLVLSSCTDIYGAGSRDLEIMWPRDNTTLYDFEVLRARVRGLDIDEYEIYWYVDDSRERRMYNEYYDRPEHKAYEVDTYNWTWRGAGPYTIGFVAEDWRGRRIAQRTVRVYVR